MENTLYTWEHLEWTSEWGAFHCALFSKPTLSLADIYEIFCVKCESRDRPLPPPPATHGVWPALQYTLSTFSFFPPVSDQTLPSYFHTMQPVGVGGFGVWIDSPCNSGRSLILFSFQLYYVLFAIHIQLSHCNHSVITLLIFSRNTRHLWNIPTRHHRLGTYSVVSCVGTVMA